MSLTLETLKKQDSSSTNAIISYLINNPSFQTLSKHEGELISIRDKEDDEKLQAGIDQAIADGVLDSITPDPYKEIYVDGKTPEEVCLEMLDSVGEENMKSSFALVLCGLSGTGKGTTVSKLKSMLETDYKRQVTCWSNGNIFRSITLLALTHIQKNDAKVEDVLTKENISEWMSMLHFEKTSEGNWDTVIKGMDMEHKVQSIQNTLLKTSELSKILPTVAKATQGQVVLYASAAIQKMISDAKDVVVLLEGRMQTVNYVESPHRFVLMLKDTDVVGQRRAAQKIMGAVLSSVGEEEASEEKVGEVTVQELEKLVKEVPKKKVDEGSQCLVL